MPVGIAVQSDGCVLPVSAESADVGALVWWCGGVVVWWCGGVVVWWCGGVVVLWCGGGSEGECRTTVTPYRARSPSDVSTWS